MCGCKCGLLDFLRNHSAFPYVFAGMNSKHNFALSILLFFGLVAGGLAQTKPNFTGTWKLNVAKSELDDSGANLIVTVEHKDPLFTYTVKGTTDGQDINETATLRTDGTPTKGPNDITFVCHWDGPTLVLNGTAADTSPIFEVSLNLSADGKTITRTIVRKNGNQQQTRHETYDKM